MMDLIHFHVRTDRNIGDAAIAYSIRDLLHRYLKTSTYTSMNVEKLKFGETRNLLASLTRLQSPKTINRYDLCIIGGGALYSSWFLPLNNQLLNSIKIPIILYGIGYGRNFGQGQLSKTQIKSIVLLNKLAKYSSVRDLLTYRFLRNLNLENVDMIGDSAIFLESKKVRELLPNSRIRIGINVAVHGWKLQSQCLNRIIAVYMKTCKFLIENLDAQIIYLKHASGEDIAINALKKRLPIHVVECCPTYKFFSRLPYTLPIQTGYCNPYKMKYVYSTLNLVIGMNLHSAVFAFASGVPMINVAYDLKNCSFMKMVRQERYLMPADRIDAGTLNKMIGHAIDNSAKTKKDFERLKDILWKKQENFLRKMRSL